MAISEKELIQRAQERVELKNVQISKSQSRDTLAFTAKVYLDGEPAAEARNSGNGEMTGITRYCDRRGGSTTFTDQIEELEEFAQSLPDVETPNSRYGPMNMTAERLVNKLAWHEDMMEDVRRKIGQGKLVFRTSDQEYGAFTHCPHHGDPADALRAMKERHDIDKVYNEGLEA